MVYQLKPVGDGHSNLRVLKIWVECGQKHGSAGMKKKGKGILTVLQ